MTKNNISLAALLGTSLLMLSACGKQAEEHGHPHDGGAEHPHNSEAEHGHPHDAPAPATEATYGDEGTSDVNTQNPEAKTEETHEHDHNHGEHGHDH
jgi:hypothetical protein